MNELPPLPDPGYSGLREDYFTEEQMRAYAAAAVAAERGAICRLVFGHCGSDNDAQRIVDAIRGMK